MAVFITDGNHRATLAVVRSLGRAGIPVTVGEERQPCLAGASRFCARTVCYPSPTRDAAHFQEFIAGELHTGGYRVLLPMTDVTTQLLVQLRPHLPPSLSLPIPDAAAIALAQDKREMLLCARRLGIGYPATFMLEPEEDLAEVARKVRYPVVIKPRLSHYFHDGRWFSGTVQYAADPVELREKYGASHAQIPRPLVQEKIEGEGRGVFLLVWRRELKSAFCHRRLREKPPWGGVSVYRESVPLDEALVQQSLRLLREISWEGVAMVEFKIDRDDGQAKLMEVNGRFWGSLQLAMDAGMDFPLTLYRLATGEELPPNLDYRPYVKSRWLLGDFDHLLLRLRHPEERNGLLRSRLHACREFCAFSEPDVHYEILTSEDPGPGLQELKDYVRDVWRSAMRRKENKA